jgi:hypothetical protein
LRKADSTDDVGAAADVTGVPVDWAWTLPMMATAPARTVKNFMVGVGVVVVY